ncbi:MAG: diaminopimelate epimerase [bacterium]|nr:diaminopimelate epimerase [bacterium]
MLLQKYSGAGNKFIIIDNLNGTIEHNRDVIRRMSEENPDIDGVIFVEGSDIADFRMNYFNKDGTGDALCGNGLRCTFRFIADNGLSAKGKLSIEAVSQIYECTKLVDERISVSFPPPKIIRTGIKLKTHFGNWSEELNCSYVDCGSPHIVIFIEDIRNPKICDLSEVKINEWGYDIRMHKDLMPEGANVNFVKVVNKEAGEIHIRSYERGVEGETLACGTGAISAATIFSMISDQNNPVRVMTQSGEYLIVEFKEVDDKTTGVILTGSAVRI